MKLNNILWLAGGSLVAYWVYQWWQQRQADLAAQAAANAPPPATFWNTYQPYLTGEVNALHATDAASNGPLYTNPYPGSVPFPKPKSPKPNVV